ncbi:MAG: TetR/AcrR family transcriptional regulator, partial [Zoogloeaceae bacterium]|nr:TetR/AcrR family transcriptional regulator [Zoogloeaceae bacterium]
MLSKRQLILNTALVLFRAYGYRAVGIDRVLAESGVAKMTLYKYFPSKTALIAAVLEERDRDFLQSLTAFVQARQTPQAQLRALFLWHYRWFQDASFNGCMFINAVAEFPELNLAVRQ